MMGRVSVVKARLFALGALLGACGDDGVSGERDTGALPDTADAVVDAGDTVTADTAPPDVASDTAADSETVLCGSITCDEPPPPECTEDRLARRSYGAVGECEFDAGGWPICRYPVTDTRCAEGEACRSDGGTLSCGMPRTTCEVALSRAGSWLSAAHLPEGDGDACCFDFDGDGTPDNGLADLAASLQPLFQTSVQEFIDAFVRRGLNAYLLQYRSLDSATEDANVGIDVLLGLDFDGIYENNLLGTERFLVRAASYDGPTPRSSFQTASITGGALRARADAMELIMPLTDALVGAGVRDVRLDAAVKLGDNGRGLTLGPLGADTRGARFGALFPLSEVFRAVNAFATGSCPCLDLGGGDLVTQGPDGWRCNNAISAACSPDDPDESVCIDLASYCGAALLLLHPDVGESYSIGLWLEGVSASFDGFVTADGSTLVCE